MFVQCDHRQNLELVKFLPIFCSPKIGSKQIGSVVRPGPKSQIEICLFLIELGEKL